MILTLLALGDKLTTATFTLQAKSMSSVNQVLHCSLVMSYAELKTWGFLCKNELLSNEFASYDMQPVASQHAPPCNSKRLMKNVLEAGV